jgi:hypothetical protein
MMNVSVNEKKKKETEENAQHRHIHTLPKENESTKKNNPKNQSTLRTLPLKNLPPSTSTIPLCHFAFASPSLILHLNCH